MSGPLGTTNQFPLDHTGSANYPVTRLCLLNCPRAGTVMESYDRNPFDFEMWRTKNINKAAIPISNPNFSLRTLFWPMELVRHLTLRSSYVLCDSQSNLREREGREKGENSEAPRPSTNTHTLKRERRIPLAAGPRTTHVLQTRRKSTPVEYSNIRYKLYLLHKYAHIKMYWNV